MIKKGSLLVQLLDLIETEKMLVPLLNRHISSALFLSGINDNERRQIKERFQSMVITQTKHIESLVKIKAEIEKARTDVY